MIKINLLPEQYRQAERTTLGTYLTVALCTILCVSAVCLVAFLYFNMLREAETKRDIAKQELEGIDKQAAYHDHLDAEKKEYMKRSEVIKDIEDARIMWTKKIDQLCDVVNNEGDSDRHWVWLKEMRIKTGNSGNDSGLGLELKGFTVGDQFELLSNFNEDLKKHPLFQKDFCGISNPTGAIVVEKKKKPVSAIEFAWKLNLAEKASKEPPKPAAEAKTAAANAPAKM